MLLARSAPAIVVDEATGPTMTDAERLTAMFTAHFDFVWRSLRRLGVHDAAVDDAAQEVFVVAQRKLRVIEHGKEKAFLFGTAVRVAADARRAHGRRRETPSDTAAAASVDHREPVDELVEQKRARELLDRVIAALPDDARPVFVLYELEGMTMAEIAACLAIPPGTVASRLRRAREAFETVIAEHKRGSDV